MAKKKASIQFRYYETPKTEPCLALVGESWVREYGSDVDSMHFHNLMEIGYCYYGEGELVIEDNARHFSGDMISCIPRNIIHTTNSERGTFSFWEYIFIDVEEFLIEQYGDKSGFAEKLTKNINKRAFFVSKEENEEFAAIIKDIFAEMKNKEKYYVESVKGQVLTLLMKIARMNSVNAEERYQIEGHMWSQIEAVLDYISLNYSKNIKISELAEICHMSETHFRRLFFESMNMLPNDYINAVRIQKACGYIKRGYESMAMVAFKTGYTTQSTFNRNFKKYMGVTPYEWRNHPENYESKLHEYIISTEKGW